MSNGLLIEIKDINGNRYLINKDEILELNTNRIVLLLKNNLEYLIKINSRQYNIIRNSLIDPFHDENKRMLEYYKRKVELLNYDLRSIRDILYNYHKLDSIFTTKKELKHFLKQIEGVVNYE